MHSSASAEPVMEAIDLETRQMFAEAMGSGDMFALFERTRSAIESYPDDPDVRYLQALAMARLGDPDAALRLYKRNRVEDIGTEDAVALKGRLFKDLAAQSDGTHRIELFRQSSEAYRTAYRLSDGYFSGINAATTAFLAGDVDEARELAAAIGRREDVAQPQDYFAAASGAEAMLVRGEVDEATALFAAARRRPDASPGMVASTARQVKLIADRLSVPDDQCQRLLAAIRPSPVVHFCGHMFRAGWELEKELVQSIDSILAETGALIAYGPLACGADILIAEAIVALGGELHVVLPFAEEDFLRTSVRVGGPEWEARYLAARDAAASVTFATQMTHVDDDELFAYCSKLVMGLAQLRAGIMHAEAFQLAVWDGRPANGVAGTAADCAEWARQGGQTRIVSIPKDRPPLEAVAVAEFRARPPWALYSMLFADFAGFSRLDEDCLSQFLEVVMGRIATVLDRHSDSVLTRNSWGDAVYAVITSPADAAEIALEIQEELDTQSLLEIGLPAEDGMRISLHHGPIFEHFDAVQGARSFYGTEVTVAARIEPRVPVGAIYTTQPFAAMIESDRNDYHFEYVGKMDLAKNYGFRILYRLGTSSE
jgi:tetratricopeptide (TPR) repeat protein